MLAGTIYFLLTFYPKSQYKSTIFFNLLSRSLKFIKATFLFLYPQKTSENQRFPNFFRGCRKRLHYILLSYCTVKWNALCESFIIYLTGDLVSAKIKSQQNFLTHFSLMIPFYIPSKHQKIFGFLVFSRSIKWDKVFKNGSSEIFGRQPLQNLKWHGLPSNFSKAVFHKFHLVHSWILCPKWEHLSEMFLPWSSPKCLWNNSQSPLYCDRKRE